MNTQVHGKLSPFTLEIPGQGFTKVSFSQVHSTHNPLLEEMSAFFFLFKKNAIKIIPFISQRRNCYTSLYNSLIVRKFIHTLELLNSAPFLPKGIQTSVIFPQRIAKTTEIFKNLVSELCAKCSESLAVQSLKQYHSVPNLM